MSESVFLNSDMYKQNPILRGTVVNVDDPEYRGRIQVRIPAIHGIVNVTHSYLLDDDLPWCTPGLWVGAGNDVGTFLVPAVGTTVFVMFEDNDYQSMVYFGGIPNKKSLSGTKYYDSGLSDIFSGKSVPITTDDTMSDVDYDHTHSQGVLFKSIKGFTIYYDDADGKESVKIIDQSGQALIFSSTNTVATRRGNSLYTNDDSKLLLAHSSKSNVTFTNKCITYTTPSTVKFDTDE